MIYLILTASLTTRRFVVNSQRSEEYRSAITETLMHLPAEIRPIIVENNGLRPTCLDHFIHDDRSVPVIYTDNNQIIANSKGVNELLDLHAVIDRIGIRPTDMIIKLTGRYRMTSSSFFNQVIHESYDAFVKFYGADSLQWDKNDCILGCYAIRPFYLKGWNPYTIDNYRSAEVAFARYIRISGARIKEMETLGVRCHFAEDGRTLDV